MLQKLLLERNADYKVQQQSGAAEACWAHIPEVRRSKLRSAMVECSPASWMAWVRFPADAFYVEY
ncbi:hypothetical protein OUZ56_010278 [Daphnia magna]|uniref:Uncharacterized protein n=1 Tax=Daphnia magna TaxID=35525 RepID=A0ABR0AI47_9CRUS|nr:hypothetical protein OUZ56_033825 [Daphnia magna]KAK4024779.1 hypothetical protein OUZ56_010267 [Daphnia magna]KAK4024785.1 hypothetical protein OUZ56_010278 [Daphnia magna]